MPETYPRTLGGFIPSLSPYPQGFTSLSRLYTSTHAPPGPPQLYYYFTIFPNL